MYEKEAIRRKAIQMFHKKSHSKAPKEAIQMLQKKLFECQKATKMSLLPVSILSTAALPSSTDLKTIYQQKNKEQQNVR